MAPLSLSAPASSVFSVVNPSPLSPFPLPSLLLPVLLLGIGWAKSPRPGAVESGRMVDHALPSHAPQGWATERATLKDARGRILLLDKPATRIVSLLPSLTEFLFELGQGHCLVGRTNWCRYPPETQSIAVVGGLENPVAESILALTPDIILAGPFLREEQVNHLESLNLKVATFDHHNWATIVRDLSLLGKIIDREDEVKKLIRGMDERRRSIETRGREGGRDKPIRTLLLYSLEPLYSCGADTFIHELIEVAGGQNVAADSASPWPMLSLETVLAKQPEVLLFSSNGGPPEEFFNRIRRLPRDPIWGQLDAVRNNRIYLLDGDTLAVAGARLVSAVEQIAAALQPDIFDAPPELIHLDLKDER